MAFSSTSLSCFFFFQAEDGIRDYKVTGVQTCALPILSSSIGDERRTNPLLGAPDEDTFIRQVLDSLGTYPPYFLRLRAVNQRGPRVLGEPGGLTPLGADDVAAL